MNERQDVTGSGHLWAIGYDDMGRADQVKAEITRLGWDEHYLLLSDVAVVVRHPDGSLTVDREPFPAVANILACRAVGFLATSVLFVLDDEGTWRWFSARYEGSGGPC